MLTQPKWDRPKEPRLLLDCRLQNAVTIQNHTPPLNIEEAIEYIAARPLCCKIDVTDGYLNNRIDPDLEKLITFLWHMGHYRSYVMQQRDCNSSSNNSSSDECDIQTFDLQGFDDLYQWHHHLKPKLQATCRSLTKGSTESAGTTIFF